MPTYEYECPKCGHRFERFQSMSDKPVRTCPECKGRKVKRLIGSGAGILFKGSGFYSTDYRSKDYTDKAKSDKEAATGGDVKKKDDSKASKPAKTKDPGAAKPAAKKGKD